MKQMIEIVDVVGREILDSRGNPTVEVEVMLDGGAVLYYQHLAPGKQQRFQDVFQMSRIEVAYFLRDLGDLVNCVFEECMDLKGHALEAWWTVVKRMDHLGQMIGYSKEARELISSMEQRMQSTRVTMPAFPYPAGTP